MQCCGNHCISVNILSTEILSVFLAQFRQMLCLCVQKSTSGDFAPAEEIARKGGGEDLSTDPAAALISDANSGAEISNEIPPRYRQSD